MLKCAIYAGIVKHEVWCASTFKLNAGEKGRILQESPASWFLINLSRETVDSPQLGMAGSGVTIVQPSCCLPRFQLPAECSYQRSLRNCGANFHSRKDTLLCSFRAFCGETRFHQTFRRARMTRSVQVLALLGDTEPGDEESDGDENSSSDSPSDKGSEAFRKQMQRMLDNDNDSFQGKDLATLIRKKYGRSYDVQLIKKEFLGRQLLAMNIMWKYREQRSFPLTEEEYILHLDSVANMLRGWGAVSYIRSSLAKTKERPRIGKAVSIFIDMDESGGRAREWIYR
eukprot:TRINITY_DN14662_c0_g1_i1.p1 TRINITY_DN14662_c0_g1~~TRINITY_DN14662_c0_g1_i1.p1  ORF type:complete len:285 (+),score=41.87 TRINITY_DN14662_c0_g1_i1:182-1036(+)